MIGVAHKMVNTIAPHMEHGSLIIAYLVFGPIVAKHFIVIELSFMVTARLGWSYDLRWHDDRWRWCLFTIFPVAELDPEVGSF